MSAGHLRMRLARFGFKSAVAQGANAYAVTVKAGDSLERIARRVIVGWIAMSASTVATYYNAGADSHYASKLDYAWATVRRRRAVLCR